MKKDEKDLNQTHVRKGERVRLGGIIGGNPTRGYLRMLLRDATYECYLANKGLKSPYVGLFYSLTLIYQVTPTTGVNMVISTSEE